MTKLGTGPMNSGGHDAGGSMCATSDHSRSDDHSTALAFTGLSRLGSCLIRISVPLVGLTSGRTSG